MCSNYKKFFNERMQPAGAEWITRIRVFTDGVRNVAPSRGRVSLKTFIIT